MTRKLTDKSNLSSTIIESNIDQASKPNKTKKGRRFNHNKPSSHDRSNANQEHRDTSPDLRHDANSSIDSSGSKPPVDLNNLKHSFEFETEKQNQTPLVGTSSSSSSAHIDESLKDLNENMTTPKKAAHKKKHRKHTREAREEVPDEKKEQEKVEQIKSFSNAAGLALLEKLGHAHIDSDVNQVSDNMAKMDICLEQDPDQGQMPQEGTVGYDAVQNSQETFVGNADEMNNAMYYAPVPAQYIPQPATMPPGAFTNDSYYYQEAYPVESNVMVYMPFYDPYIVPTPMGFVPPGVYDNAAPMSPFDPPSPPRASFDAPQRKPIRYEQAEVNGCVFFNPVYEEDEEGKEDNSEKPVDTKEAEVNMEGKKKQSKRKKKNNRNKNHRTKQNHGNGKGKETSKSAK
ncbi:predicted protein [Chaetoceros tenuissimus]|uniref:Uncharacterized protein n=1 Tax=Chaetoceros tenuissimus TaxID=426638 RepID=A0AAD3D4I1_9STRA|nr:predicted protein [Chaetoceros tenuissimus]